VKSGRGYLFVGMESAGYACLESLLAAGVAPAAVVTVDESCRQGIAAFRSFRELDDGRIPFHYVEKLATGERIAMIRDLAPELIVTAYWSEMIPPEVLSVPRLGCIGLHGTKLPKHRGRAPIPWSILFGLRRGGMTLFRLETAPDSGAILAQAEYPIGPDDYAATVYERAAACAARLVADVVPRLLSGEKLPAVRPELKLDYWRRREPDDGFVDWWMAAGRIYDWVRALSRPFPGAYGVAEGRRIRIWRAAVASDSPGLPPGRVTLNAGGELIVGTGDGSLVILEMECEGRPLSAPEFIRRHAAAGFYC
jgi:methionyl-tRNA formyltransferase